MSCCHQDSEAPPAQGERETRLEAEVEKVDGSLKSDSP